MPFFTPRQGSARNADKLVHYQRVDGVIEVDIRGQICPSTLLTALKEVNEHKQALKEGTLELRFSTDNRDATITIPEALENMGYEVKISKEGGHYVMVIRAAKRRS